MKIFISLLFTSTLLLNTSFAFAEDTISNADNITDNASTQTSEQAPAKNTLFSTLKKQIIADLNKELNDPSELSEQERTKVLRAIEALQEMETLGDLSNINDILELNIKDNKQHHNQHYNPHHNNNSFAGDLVPIFAIVFVFGTPIAIVGIVTLINLRRTRLQHATLNKLIESGQEVPPELLTALQGKSASTNYLQKGLTLCGVGIGIFVAAHLMGSTKLGAIAFIPFFIGVAQLLIWKLDNKNTENNA